MGDYDSKAHAQVDGTVVASNDFELEARATNIKNATNASASVTNTPTIGSIAKHFQKKSLRKEFKKSPRYFDGNAAKPRARDYKGAGTILWNNKELPIAVGGAITIADTNNEARAIVGSTGDIQATGNVNVVARAEDNYQVYAAGAAGEAEVSIGGAVCFAFVGNNSEALISPNAKVDSGKILNVRSEAVVPNQVSFVNLGLDLNDSDDTGLDASGKVTRRYDDGVNAIEVIKAIQDSILLLLSSASVIGGTVSTTLAHSAIAPSQKADGKLGITFGINVNRLDNDSKAAIESGALINQRVATTNIQDVKVESFSHVETINLSGLPTLLGVIGEPGASQSNAAGGHLDVITHQTNSIAYIADGAVVSAGRDVIVTGSSFNAFLSAAQAGGKSGGITIEGAVSFVSIGAATYAYIDDQADVEAGRDVLVTADNDTYVIDVAGTLSLSGSVGVGVSVALAIIDNNTHAFIGDNPYDNVAPTTPPKEVTAGRDAQVKATSGQKLFNFALAGTVVAPFDLGPADQQKVKDGKIGGGLQETSDGKAFGVGVSGDAALNFLDDDVSAFVTSPITVGGDLTVDAENTTVAVASGGALAIAATSNPTPAIGGSYAANFITKSALAYIGGVTVTVGDDVTVNSHSTNTIVTVSASGSAASRAGAVAGSVTTPALINNVRAVISSGAVVNASGDVTVNADNSSRVITVTGAGAGGGSGFGVGAAISINIVDETSIASIGGTISDPQAGPATVVHAGGDVRVTSLSDNFVLVVSASLGLAVTSGVGAAGTISSATLTQNVQSLISNGSTVTTPNSLLLDSEANADMGHIGGAGAGGKSASIGATIANTNLFRTNRARVGSGATISAGGAGNGVLDRHQVGGNGLIIDATSNDNFVTVAIGAAVAAQGAGIGASLNVMTVESDVTAQVLDHATINLANAAADSRQNVKLRATHDIVSVGVAGGVGGSTQAGIGAAIDTETITRNVRATIDNDSIVNARNAVDIQAHSEEDAISIVFGVGIATSGVGVAGSVSTVNISGDTEARIGDRTLVNANSVNTPVGNEVRVVATGDTSIFSLAGTVGIGGQVGVGAGASGGSIDTEITASIGNSAQVRTTTLVLVQADSQEKIVSFATNGGGGGTVGVAGSIDVWNVQVDVDAAVGQYATIFSEGTVAVIADGSTDMSGLSGAISGSGKVGVGASVAVLVLDKNVLAHIDDHANVTALGVRGGIMAADTLSTSYSAADSSQGDVQPPSNSSLFSIDTDGDQISDASRSDASLNQKRRANIERRLVNGLIVTATNRVDMDTLAVSGAASGFVSVAIGGAVSVAVTSTAATIGNDVAINTNNTGAAANQDVHVVALSDLHHLGVTVGASGAGIVSVSPGVDVLVVDATTRAAIGDRSTVNAASNVTVQAKAIEKVLSVSGGVAASGFVGVAGMVSVPSITSHVIASIGANAVVDAGGSIAVIALDDTDAVSFVGSAGIGSGSTGVGGAVGVIVISKETQATVGNSAKLTSRGTSATTRQHSLDDDLGNVIFTDHSGVIVYARAVEDVFNLVLAGGAGYAAGVAGAVGVTSVESTTLAQVGDSAELTAADDVMVTAVNRAIFLSIGGAAGVSAGAGVAGGVDVGVVQNQTSAIVGHDAKLNGGDDVRVLALSDKSAKSYAVSLGAASFAGVAGAFSVWSFGTSLNDRFEVTDNVNDDRSGAASSQNVLATDGRTDTEYGSATQYANSMTGGQHSGGGYGSMLNGISSEGDQQKFGSLSASTSARMNSSSSRTQIDFSKHDGGGTQALVGANSKLTAGDVLAVQAHEKLTFSATTGSGAAGVAGVGGSVTIVMLNELNQAVIGSAAELTAPTVTISANMNENTSGHAYAGQIGVATLGAQVVVVNDNNSQLAALDNGVIVQGKNVTITADVTRDLNLDTFGAALSFGGTAGVSASVANVGGYTVAEVKNDASLGTSSKHLGNSLTVRATSDADINAVSRGVGASIGPFAVATGIGANATGRVNSAVAARIGVGTDIFADGSVTIEAVGQHNVSTESLGVAVSAGVAVGAVSSRAEIVPTIDTIVNGGGEIVASSLTVRSRFNHDGSSPVRDGDRANAWARGRAAGGALLAGVAGAGVDAISQPVIHTTVYGGVHTANSINVRTDASFDADAKGLAVPLGLFVAIGVCVVDARANGIAETASAATWVAQDIDLVTNANAVAKADADAVGGALLAGGVGSQAIATASPTLSTFVATGGSVQTSNSFDLLTQSRGVATSQTTTATVNGILGVGGLTSRATVSPNVLSTLGQGVIVHAGGSGGMRLAALHNVSSSSFAPLPEVGATSESGSLVVALGGSISVAVTEANARANVVATLSPSLDLSGSSTITVNATSANLAFANLDSRSGALINISSSNPTAVAAGTTTAALQSNVSNVGSLLLNASSKDRSSTTLKSSGGGLIDIGASSAEANAGSTTTALVGTGLTLNLSGDLSLYSGGISEADSSARSGSGGGLTINSISSLARSTPIISSDIGMLTTINAGGLVALTADAPVNRDFGSRTQAESGDGYTTAAAVSGSGGAITVQDADSTTIVNTTAVNHIGASSKINASTILINAYGETMGEVLTAAGGGGIFASGGVDADVSQTSRVSNSIDGSAVLNATGAISILATGVFDNYGNTRATIGGAIAFVSANTTLRLNHTVTNSFGGYSTVTAGGNLLAQAQTFFTANGRSEANAGGLGSDTKSSNSGGNPGASDNKGVIITGTTSTDVFDNAKLKAGSIALKGIVGSGQARMETRSVAGGFGTDADGVANVDMSDIAAVNVFSGAVVEAIGRIDFIADHRNVDARSDAFSQGRSAFGDSDATAITNLRSNSRVATSAGSKIIAHDLNSEATFDVLGYDRKAVSDGGIDFGSQRERGNFLPGQYTDWYGDIVINGPLAAPRLVMNELGQVESNNGVTVRTNEGVVAAVSGLTITPEQVGSVRFFSRAIGSFDKQFSLGSNFSTADFLSTSRPTLTFNDSFKSIDIINRGSQGLLFAAIDAVGANATPKVTIDINNISTQGTVFNVQRNIEPTAINIDTKGGVIFNGNLCINNPVGSTTINAANLSFDTIRSHNLTIHANGEIGALISTGNGNQITSRYSGIELTQTSAGAPSLDLQSNATISVSITGLQRTNDPFVANFNNITAPRLNLEINPAKQQLSGGKVGPVLVEKLKPASGIFPIPAFSKFVNTRLFVSSFGFNLDPELFNNDAFGQSTGKLVPATYRASGPVLATNPNFSNIVVKPDALLDFLHFEDAVTLPSAALVPTIQKWGDLNGDGALDLVTVSDSTLMVLINELATNNSFRVALTENSGNGIHSIALGDVDNDGDLDLALQQAGITSIRLNDGTGAYNIGNYPVVNLFASGTGGELQWADVDNNGRLDLIDAGVRGVFIHLMKNNLTQELKTVSTVPYSRIDLGDYDSDGDIDLLAGGNGQAGRSFENDTGNFGSTTFEFPLTTTGPLQFGDSNGDGKLDVLVLGAPNSNGQSRLSIYENNGSTFDEKFTQTGAISSALWNDHDADGDLDLLVHYTGPDRNQLLINAGSSLISSDARELPDGITLRSWSTANVVNGRGLDLAYAGLQNGQPYFHLLQNRQPVLDSTPAVVGSVSAVVTGPFATINWTSPAGSSNAASPYSYNLRLQRLYFDGSSGVFEPTREVSTSSGRGALNSNSFVVRDLVVGSTYFYSVQTVDSLGRRSAWSQANSFTNTGVIVVNQPGDTDDGEILNNSTTLREAINFVTANDNGRYTIQVGVDPGVVNPFTITKSMRIESVATFGSTISANGTGRIFNIDDGTSSRISVSLKGLILTGGRADFGGAIYSTEDITLDGLTFVNNQATQDGGAIYLNVPAGGTANINGIKSGNSNQANSAGRDGGMLAIANSGTVTFIGDNLLESANGSSATRNGGTISIVNSATGRIVSNGRYEILRSSDSTAGQDGGAISVINNGGYVDLTGLSGEVSDAGRFGGGLYLQNNGGIARISQRYTGNTAAYGGGIYIANNGGEVTMFNGTSEFNSSKAGAGIFLEQSGGSFKLKDAYFDRNTTTDANDIGGGVIAINNHGGFVSIDSNLIYDGHSASGGGGLSYFSDGETARASIVGNTFVGNTAKHGAAIDANVAQGTLEFISNTVSGNTLTGAGASGPAGIELDVGAGALASVVANTIAFNDARNAPTGSAVSINAAIGSTVLVRNTLIADNKLADGASAYVFTGDASGLTYDANWVGDNAGLKPLAITGGLLPTHSLTATSPVLNIGADPVLLPIFDQRGDGFPRAVGRPDIGAIERPLDGSRTIVVSTPINDVDGDVSDGKLSLEEALRLANAAEGTDTIIFSPALFDGAVVNVNSPHFLFSFQGSIGAITDSLRIVGPGISRLTISGALFDINDGNPNSQISFEMSDVTLQNTFGFSTTENTKLEHIVATSMGVRSRPDAGATVLLTDSFYDRSGIDVGGLGETIIDNSTLVATDAVPATFTGIVERRPNAIVANGSKLTVRNSTLTGRRQETFGAPLVISSLTGGIIGKATVISSIVPTVGAGSTLINSLLSDGDAAGLAATTSTGLITIDTTAPTTPAIDTLTSPSNDSTPTISGTAEANASISIVIDPDNDATTLDSFTLTTTADDKGQWSSTVPDEHAFRSGQSAAFVVTATDAAKNTSKAATTGIDIDTTAPAVPIVVFPSKVNSHTPTFTGIAEPGSQIIVNRLFFNSTQHVTTVTADSNGRFSFVGPQTDGSVEAFLTDINLSLSAVDSVGNVSAETTGTYRIDTQRPFIRDLRVSESPSFPPTPTTPAIIGDAEANSAIVVTVDPDNNAATHNSFKLFTTANSSGGFSVNVPAEHALTVSSTYAVSAVSVDAVGNVSDPDTVTQEVTNNSNQNVVFISPSVVNDATPTLSFVISSSFSNPDVFIDYDNNPSTDNSVDIRSSVTQTSVGGGTRLTYTIPNGNALIDGQTISLTVSRVVGGFGNATEDHVLTITADLTAPDAPTVDIPDWFNSSTPTLSGTAEAQSSVLVTIDPDNNSATFNSLDLSTTAGADGKWSLTIPAEAGLQNGSSASVSAQVVDAAGNISTATTDSFTVDLTAPSTPVLYLASTVTSATPTLSGLIEPLADVTLVIDPDNDAGTDNSVTLTTTATAIGGFSVTYPTDLSDGATVSVIATITDAAGNSASSAPSVFTVDLSNSGGTSGTTPDARVPSTGGLTNDTTPTIYGVGRPNSPITVDIDPDNDVVTANTISLQTTSDGDGKWSVTVADADAFTDGQVVGLVVIESDANGNLIGSKSGTGILDPRIALISFLGGEIPVASLRQDSPAIDAGSNPLNLANDARGEGFARVTGAAADIGSYEVQPAVFVVTVANQEDNGDYTPDDLSFREAILLANKNPGTDTIRFAANLTSVPISLVSPSEVRDYNAISQSFLPQVAITDSVNIEGRADRSLKLTATDESQNIINLPDSSFYFGKMFTIDDGKTSDITVRISGVTLSDTINAHENLILDNVTLNRANGQFNNVLVADRDLTLSNATIDSSAQFMRFFVTGQSKADTSVVWDNVIIDGQQDSLIVTDATVLFRGVNITAPQIRLAVTDSDLTIDKLHLAITDLDLAANGLRLDQDIDFDSLRTFATNSSVTVKDSDYRASVQYYFNINNQKIASTSQFNSSALIFSGTDANNSLVLNNSRINGWASKTIDPATAATNEDTFIDIDLRPLAVVSGGASAGTISGVSNPIGGTVSLRPDGFTARFIPNSNFNGAASFDYSVAGDIVAKATRDFPVSNLTNTVLPTANSAFARGTVNLSVAAVDDAFTVNATAQNATEDQTLDIDLKSFVADIDSSLDGLTFTLGSTSSASASLLPDGHTARVTFPADYFGSASISFTISNGTQTESDINVPITVASVNDAPTLAVPSPEPTLKDTQTVALSDVSIADVDSNNLSVTVSVDSGSLQNGSTKAAKFVLNGNSSQINSQLDSLLFVPQSGISIISTLSVQANDDAAGSRSSSFSIGVAANQAPQVFADSDTVSIYEGLTASQIGSFSDINGDEVTLTASIGSVVKNDDGSWLWRGSAPTTDGPYSFDVTITATDPDNVATFTTFTVNVLDAAPTAPADADDADNVITESAVNGDYVHVTAQATAIRLVSLTYSLTNDAGGRFRIDSTTGFVYVKDASLIDFESAASHIITVQASDGTDTSTQNFTINIANVAPTQPSDADSLPNALSARASNGDLVHITAQASDIRGGNVTFSLTNDAGGRFQIDSTTGVVSLKDHRLLGNAGDSYSITVQASDGTDTSTQDFAISVNASNPQDWINGAISLVTIGGTTTITDNDPSAGSTIKVQIDDGSLLVTIGAVEKRVSLRDRTSIVVNGGAGDDTLIVDLNGGAFPFDVTFNCGSGDNDALQTSGFDVSTQFNALTANYSNTTDGRVVLRNGATPRTTTLFTGLDQLTIDGSPTEVFFNLPEGDDVATLQDINGADNKVRLSGSSFTTTTFSVSAATSIAINANGGNDRITVQALDANYQGVVAVEGGSGNNLVDAATATISVRFTGGAGSDSFIGGSGNDVFNGSAGDDMATGGDGDDILLGGNGRDRLSGNNGNDNVKGQGSSGDTISGGAGNDLLDGGDGLDVLDEAGDVNFLLTALALTGLGTDVLAGLESAVLTGGNSNNLINASGFAGTLTLNGGEGQDTLLGGASNDALSGGGGDDVMQGGGGDDTLSGGTGSDTLDAGDGSGDVLSEVTIGNLTLTATDLRSVVGVLTEIDTLSNFERAFLIGGNQANRLDAAAFAMPVTLLGGGGNDVLIGGTQADSLDGQAGNDTLTGGSGSDTLNGGAGSDLFRDVAYSSVVAGQLRTITLTNTSFAMKAGTDTLFADSLLGLESADISGGSLRDFINATGFVSTSVTTISGGGGNDVIFGTPGADLILTLTGADVISAGGGDDTIAAGSGNDTINGGEGADYLNGQNGNDSIVGEDGDDMLVGGVGLDTLIGNAGNDFLSGQSDAGLLMGGDGNDSLQGNTANDTLQGDSGDDRLYGLQGDDVIDAGDGADSLVGGIGNDALAGGAGTDTLQGDVGNDTLDGGVDFDRISEVFDTNLTIVGSTVSASGFGVDVVQAIERIQINGGSSNNIFDARQANVPVFLSGGAGDDTLLGGSKSDFLSGGSGNDVLSGGAANDVIDGGDGIDYLLESANSNFTVNGVTITSSATGIDTPTFIERIVLIGGIGANKLDASLATVPVVLIGGRGNDTLLGGSASDTLTGGNRNDATVVGGDGVDSLNGGAGADVLENDQLDTISMGGGDAVVADVFALLPSWIDLL